MSSRENFGGRIERLRLLADLTSRGLDELAGLQPGHSRQIERGLRPNVSADTIALIADAFGVSGDWLFRGLGESPKPDDVRAAVGRARRMLVRRPKAAS